jgi:hypothetical protein
MAAFFIITSHYRDSRYTKRNNSTKIYTEKYSCKKNGGVAVITLTVAMWKIKEVLKWLVS